MAKKGKKRIAVFLDRDGTLNEEVGYLDSLTKLAILPGAVEAVRLINQAGFLAIVITNQSGIARGFFDETFVHNVHERLQALFHAQGAVIDAFYYCPHHPTEGRGPYLMPCSCRKPSPGLLLQAAEEWNIDLESSFMVGDTPKDIEAGHRAGCKGIFVLTGHGRHAVWDATGPDHTAFDVLSAVKWIMRETQKARESV